MVQSAVGFMNNTNFDNLKIALQTKLVNITTGPDKRGGIVIQHSADALDQTQFAAERDLVVSLLNHDTQLYRRLQSALQRMDEGTYGICLACEESIGVKRLQALPWAEFCLRCQERSDMTAAGVLIGDREDTIPLGV